MKPLKKYFVNYYNIVEFETAIKIYKNEICGSYYRGKKYQHRFGSG